jgi:type IV pilus assembly protein PilC
MPNYKYKAMSETGAPVSGVVAAADEAQAMQMLAARGLIPQAVRAGGSDAAEGGGGVRFLQSVKPQELILFTKQVRTMVHAGISIVNVFRIMEQQSGNPLMRRTVSAVVEELKQGTTLYDAFARHPKVFNELYCAMLRAGEISGNLVNVFDRLIYLIDHEYKVRKQIISALTYPAIVLVMLVGAFLFLLSFVVPKFAMLFERAGIDLPVPTEICIAMYKGLSAYWPMMLLGTVAVVGGAYLYVRTPVGRLNKDRLTLALPLVGPVFQKAAMSRFASIFGLLQSSGVSVLASLDIISRTIGNAAISRVFDGLGEKLREGRGISAPLRSSDYFPPMVVNMIAVGEESGNLEDMLTEVAAHYDYEVEYQVGRMAEMIGPLLMVALSAVVGFFALAIFMPMWDLTKMAH